MLAPLVLKKCDGFYQIPLLEHFQVRGFITTRVYNMAFEDDAGVSGRRQAYEAMEVNGRGVICPQQVHSDGIFFAGFTHKGRGSFERKTSIKAADALVTDVRRIPIGILTADCLPVFIMDKNRQAMALVHAGWRGIKEHIVAKTIKLMAGRLCIEPSQLLVILGPCIRPCCYEVGEEFLSYFQNFLLFRGKKTYFDLQSAAVDQLLSSGVHKGFIYDTFICTSCHNKEFFSYRREGVKAGRSMFIAEML